ncbi:kinase-like domain-containing protein [Roridomyces roridus]|uniref:Kinase-like domain-containing protein n=1 Tax=Roridomyces roridus TaxID=1738132 RepID=A0AAD7BLM8_9AGAR|nr:kinase-like domain-containing protein [Roridomyces roridus]
MPHFKKRIPNLTGCVVDDGTLLLKKLVGAGAFGKLYRGVETESACSSRRSSWASSSSDSSLSSSESSSSSESKPRVYAVKCLRNTVMYDGQESLAANERHFHSLVSNHPNIVTLRRHFTDSSKKHMFFVMDFYSSGDMSLAIADGLYHRNSALIKRTFAQLGDAVTFCHNLGVYHRDIKPENILVDHEGENPRLTDFGLATCYASTYDYECGTIPYMPPESFLESCTGPCYSDFSDAWALGITLINLVASQLPWDAARVSTDARFNEFIGGKKSFLHRHQPLSRPLIRFLARFLHLEPWKRIPLAEFAEKLEGIEDLFISEEELERASEGTREWARREGPGRPLVGESHTHGVGRGVIPRLALPVCRFAVGEASQGFRGVLRRLRFWRK